MLEADSLSPSARTNMPVFWCECDLYNSAVFELESSAAVIALESPAALLAAPCLAGCLLASAWVTRPLPLPARSGWPRPGLQALHRPRPRQLPPLRWCLRTVGFGPMIGPNTPGQWANSPSGSQEMADPRVRYARLVWEEAQGTSTVGLNIPGLAQRALFLVPLGRSKLDQCQQEVMPPHS